MLGVLLGLLLTVPAPVFAQEAAPAAEYEKLLAEADERCAAGEHAAAIELYAKAAGLRADAARPIVGLARCELAKALKTGDPRGLARVRSLLREALSREKDYGGVFFLWGELCLAERNHAGAVQAFRGALVKDFRSREAKPLLAKSMLWLGADQARDSRVPHEQVVEVLAEAERALGALVKDESYPEAERMELEAFRRKALVNMAAVHQRANDLPRAEEIVRELIRLDPKNRDYRFSLGLLLAASNRSEAATRAYEKAIALNDDPDWVEACRPLGHLKSVGDEVEAAEKLLRRFLGKRPESWDGWLTWGDHLVRHGRPDEAAAAYERCIELHPGRTAAIRKLSQTLRRAGRGPEADKWSKLFRVMEAE
ncbi:MAG: tetratricopeptide repeat protein [Planctomycetota bacterium]